MSGAGHGRAEGGRGAAGPAAGRGRRAAIAAMLLAIPVLLIASWQLRGPLIEEWWLFRLRSDDPAVWAGAARRLETAGTPRAIPGLLRALMLEPLGPIEDRQPQPSAGPPEILAALDAAVLDRSGGIDALMRTFAEPDLFWPSVGYIEDAALGPVSDRIGQNQLFRSYQVRSYRPGPRKERILAAFVRAPLAPAIVTRVLSEGDTGWRRGIKEVLSRLATVDPEGAHRVVAPLLLDSDPSFRAEGRRLLEGLGVDLVPFLLPALRSADPVFRLEGLKWLSSTLWMRMSPASRSALEESLQALAGDPDGEVRTRAAAASKNFQR